ncbi:putative pentatricopeptide repeat-containing protein At5g59200, chloroplastic [Solanum stenotomum]|uniref:putative pentatricopeptide repeat-containing protein At5g59200, chloroplastic n=1 Tax=Solanum stenotomum TaxID=172797 RepID=UPI0020D0CABD|nr:putative pentatricopeptide repeat-containing protein At5g59200, chloroplastic [Solanum stenotomum]
MAQDEELEVKDFIRNNEWDVDKLRSVISEEMVQHIVMNIKARSKVDDSDKAWWVRSTNGFFTVKSAYQTMRSKRAEKEWSKFMCIKGLPFKIGFFLWRVFDAMEQVCIWNAMISSLALMMNSGLQHNEIAFVAVLSTLSHEFGLAAKMKHYGCVVDLLQEAYDFIKKMPFEADATVLGACRLGGAIELGNEVAQLLLESKQNHSGRYV